MSALLNIVVCGVADGTFWRTRLTEELLRVSLVASRDAAWDLGEEGEGVRGTPPSPPLPPHGT